MSAHAELFGGGGLGDFAITYGSRRYNWLCGNAVARGGLCQRR
jgi:ABC-type methionine transport system permease subunit